jgi:hypothetical protein
VAALSSDVRSGRRFNCRLPETNAAASMHAESQAACRVTGYVFYANYAAPAPVFLKVTAAAGAPVNTLGQTCNKTAGCVAFTNAGKLISALKSTPAASGSIAAGRPCVGTWVVNGRNPQSK